MAELRFVLRRGKGTFYGYSNETYNEIPISIIHNLRYGCLNCNRVWLSKTVGFFRGVTHSSKWLCHVIRVNDHSKVWHSLYYFTCCFIVENLMDLECLLSCRCSLYLKANLSKCKELLFYPAGLNDWNI